MMTTTTSFLVPDDDASNANDGDERWRIIHKSCERLKDDVMPASVALTLTSPPYWNAIDYDLDAEVRDNSKGFKADSDVDYKQRNYDSGTSYEQYIARMADILGPDNVMQATAPGGFLALNVSTVLHEKRLHPLPFDMTAALCDSGWEFFADIIWNKVTSKGSRAGVYIQNPRLGYFYPNFMHEYLLVFRKPGPVRRGNPELSREAGGLPIDRLYTQDICNTVWHIAPVSPNQIDHPCPFPAELARRVIRLWSDPGDLVLDPFAGAGTTGVVAVKEGRRFVGYETEQKYVDVARERIANPERPRAHNLIPSYDKIPAE